MDRSPRPPSAYARGAATARANIPRQDVSIGALENRFSTSALQTLPQRPILSELLVESRVPHGTPSMLGRE